MVRETLFAPEHSPMGNRILHAASKEGETHVGDVGISPTPQGVVLAGIPLPCLVMKLVAVGRGMQMLNNQYDLASGQTLLVSVSQPAVDL